jgi:hypothetical protein
VEENGANFGEVLDGKPLLSALCSMYAVTQNKLKAVVKVNAQAGQCGERNLSGINDDIHDVKRCKRCISNNISQTANKSTKPILISAAVKLPPKSVLSRSSFTPLRTTVMDTETTGSENSLPE